MSTALPTITDEPYVMAGLNVVAADSDAEAQQQLQAIQRQRISWLLGGGRIYTEAEADRILQSHQGRQLMRMMTYTAVGRRDDVAEYVEGFTKHADADELIVVPQGTTAAARLRPVELVAEACGLQAPDEEGSSLTGQALTGRGRGRG